MERETRLASARLPELERATIHGYEDGVPGPFFYQRMAHPVGAEAERLLGELEGGQALLFPSGSGATTALALALLSRGRRSPSPMAATRDGRTSCAASSVGGDSRSSAFDQTAPPPPADLVWLEPCSNPVAHLP